MYLIYSPLEQFTIIPIIIISNMTIVLGIIGIIMIILYNISGFIWIKHIEWWNVNLKNINDHIFIILTIFLLILLSNLIGMIPYTITITAQFIFVLSISLILFISINVLGWKMHKWKIFYLFLPSGVPILLWPFITLLEIFLYFIRILSLTLRLSINMVAGHILIKIIISVFMSLPILSFLILPILILELFIAFLQAYIYLTLTISYYQDVILPH